MDTDQTQEKRGSGSLTGTAQDKINDLTFTEYDTAYILVLFH